jgi:hypothetical protein
VNTRCAAASREVRSKIKERQNFTFTKHQIDRVKNFLPIRIFRTMADLCYSKGLLNEADLVSAVSKVNSEQNLNETFKSALSNLQDKESFKLEPQATALSLRQVWKSVFPHGQPVFNPVSDYSALLSALNLTAGSGYPLYVKKNKLKEEIATQFRLLQSGE